ncbi:MAG: 50S ribosomal protein L18 [Thermodesulfobacteriota bacterium]
MGARTKTESRLRRKKRITRRIRGTAERPRLSVFRTSKHIYAQIIDDGSGRTLVDASSLSKEVREQIAGRGGNKQGALAVGELLAKRATERGITKVVFDRNGFLYHGRIKVLADAAREKGLLF